MHIDRTLDGNNASGVGTALGRSRAAGSPREAAEAGEPAGRLDRAFREAGSTFGERWTGHCSSRKVPD